MNNEINITSGTLSILNQIMNQNPERHLALFQSASHSNHILIDTSQLRTIFNSPIQYLINKYKGSQHWGIFTSFIHLTLNHYQIKVLLSYINKTFERPLVQNMINIYCLTNKIDPSKKILLTNWKDFKSYVIWKNNSFIKFFTKSNNNYYQTNFYHIR